MTSGNNFKGKTWKIGDNISTDHILPSRYMTMVEPHELASNCLAGISANYAKRFNDGDILVAGDNMGYGSSREQAPYALKYAGISTVVARSFARIFYRNCYNLGLPAIVCPEFVDDLTEGDVVGIDLNAGTIDNITKCATYTFVKPPEFLMEYVKLGGLIPYLGNILKVKKVE
jgi:3-isopropylmalate dehydratase small subunit